MKEHQELFIEITFQMLSNYQKKIIFSQFIIKISKPMLLKCIKFIMVCLIKEAHKICALNMTLTSLLLALKIMVKTH